MLMKFLFIYLFLFGGRGVAKVLNNCRFVYSPNLYYSVETGCIIGNSYTMVCPPVRGDHESMSGLPPVQGDKRWYNSSLAYTWLSTK